jgi:hypothetical protein
MNVHSTRLLALFAPWPFLLWPPRRASSGTSRAAFVMAAILSLGPAAALHAESRFSDARLVIDKHRFPYDHVDEVQGVLVSDTAAGQLRFEADGRVLFEAAYDRLTALHYEQSKYRGARSAGPVFT